jgi:hypothetical protein
MNKWFLFPWRSWVYNLLLVLGVALVLATGLPTWADPLFVGPGTVPRTPPPTWTPEVSPTATPKVSAMQTEEPWIPFPARFGVAFAAGHGSLSSYPLKRLPFGWYLDYGYQRSPQRPNGVEYVQVLPSDAKHYPPVWSRVRAAVRANPGALWIIGNEPECVYQDAHTPEEYAKIYHEYYTFLKKEDSTAQVAIGGIVAPTPLRLEWLGRVLESYEGTYGELMNVDVWNIHNQLLQEKSDDYGAGIPVGIDATEGELYPWWRNDDVAIFEEQVIAFRQWMADNGQRDKPLIISEFGVLYPSSWFDGLGGPKGDERVKAFMTQTYEFLSSATDEELGFPADENRLVQRWAWYGLNNLSWEQSKTAGFNGNLTNARTRRLTPFGEHYEQVVKDLLESQ